jgi:hypothetical protein
MNGGQWQHGARTGAEAPDAGDTSHIRGLATRGERMLILVDIASMLLRTDMGLVDGVVH